MVELDAMGGVAATTTGADVGATAVVAVEGPAAQVLAAGPRGSASRLRVLTYVLGWVWGEALVEARGGTLSGPKVSTAVSRLWG